ncbi:hypothetical protein [Pseudomonas sp. UBA6562]|uniref:hypothetical protein n=1 Tax=Pseudomonas sp. UBA6562 TaxID=1947332 RepID=UPI0025F507AF|nr:hypothetical protein [Pseudomonas sp. UBA6562]
MKKPVPDPPHIQSTRNYYLINQDLSPLDALSHTLELMVGIEATLDEYICANAGEPGMPMLVNTLHQLQMVKTLTQFVLQRVESE